jgi:hypothetical protein
MANELLISYDRYTLQQIDIYDATDYPIGLVTKNSINQTRFLFATVNTINNRQLDVTTLEAYKEYDLVGTGSITVNGVTYSAGSSVVFANDETPTIPAGLTINESGYYVPYSTYIPSVYDYATIIPSSMGLTGNVFPDSVIHIIYETYTTEYLAGATAPSGTYIVQGTQGDSISIGGETYYVGEVFTKGGSFTFTNNAGTNKVVKYFQSGDAYTWTDYNAYQVYESYVQALAQGKCGCDSDFVGNYLKVYSLLNSLYISAERDVNVDTDSMQAALDEINTLYSVKPMC